MNSIPGNDAVCQPARRRLKNLSCADAGHSNANAKSSKNSSHQIVVAQESLEELEALQWEAAADVSQAENAPDDGKEKQAGDDFDKFTLPLVEPLCSGTEPGKQMSLRRKQGTDEHWLSTSSDEGMLTEWDQPLHLHKKYDGIARQLGERLPSAIKDMSNAKIPLQTEVEVIQRQVAFAANCNLCSFKSYVHVLACSYQFLWGQSPFP